MKYLSCLSDMKILVSRLLISLCSWHSSMTDIKSDQNLAFKCDLLIFWLLYECPHYPIDCHKQWKLSLVNFCDAQNWIWLMDWVVLGKTNWTTKLVENFVLSCCNKLFCVEWISRKSVSRHVGCHGNWQGNGRHSRKSAIRRGSRSSRYDKVVPISAISDSYGFEP